MRKALYLALAMVLALVVGAPLPVQAQVPPSIAATDPDLMMVRLAGTWTAVGEKGQSRLLVSRDRATNGMRLFVQWIGGGVVLATVEVPEIAARQLKITSINIDAGAGETAVHLGVASLVGGDDGGGSTTLIIRGPGEIEFQASGN
jgi:hypothetical protein